MLERRLAVAVEAGPKKFLWHKKHGWYELESGWDSGVKGMDEDFEPHEWTYPTSLSLDERGEILKKAGLPRAPGYIRDKFFLRVESFS